MGDERYERYERAAREHLFIAEVQRLLAVVLPDDETTLEDLPDGAAEIERAIATASEAQGYSYEVGREIAWREVGPW